MLWRNDPVRNYHDVMSQPVHDDIKLPRCFWKAWRAVVITILKKREAFREAFDGFDPYKVALYDDGKIQELLINEKIIRNRLKINAAVSNAKAFLRVIEEYGSFDKFIWGYVNYTPVTYYREKPGDIPAKTPLSDKISNDLKKMGFRFVGSTIIYSFMQAIGMVNDHTTDCFVFKELLNR